MPLVITAKVNSTDILPGELPLFPTEKHEGISLSQTELFKFSKEYGLLYDQLIDLFSLRIAEHYTQPLQVVKILARVIFVPLTHFFMDRLIRLSLLLNANKETPLAIGDPGPYPLPESIDSFREQSPTSYHLNQHILCRFAEIFNLQTVPISKAQVTPPVTTILSSSTNHNYAQTFIQKFKRALLWLPHKIVSHIFQGIGHGVPVLSMGYATPILQSKGLYGFSGFYDLCGRIHFKPQSKNQELRETLLGQTLDKASTIITDFLRKNDITNPNHHTKIFKSFRNFIIDFCPSQLLEGIESNLQSCQSLLKKINSRAIVAVDPEDTVAVYFFAAAKSLNMVTIGCQNGGHEGYEEDYVPGIHFIYQWFDYFITWGWSRFPEAPGLEKLKTILLPSPWFSMREKRLGSDVKHTNLEKPYDLLFVPNKIYRYPPAPSGGCVSRIDHIKSFASLLKTLISRSADEKIRILHKPCNASTVELLATTLKDLELLGGKYYQLIDKIAKGLNKDLINRCHVVLWDQPGTGFLECLVSKIPTMILWPRLYNQEVSWANDIFLKLESVGIIHRNVDSLLHEYKEYKKNPEDWKTNKKRCEVINQFCNEYSLSNQHWPKEWKKFIKSVHSL